MKWINDGDGNHESECGRMCISRRYQPGGSPAGWGVDIEGESGTAHLTDTFAAAKAWANEEAKSRGWDHKLRWDCKASGHHEAILPDGAVLVAKLDPSGKPGWWQCHRWRGDDPRWLASACSWRHLRNGVKELGEDAYR